MIELIQRYENVSCEHISYYFCSTILHMGLSEQIRRKIQEYFINRLQPEETLVSRFENLKLAKSLSMFFCINTKKELDQIRHLTSRAGKDYNELGVYIFSDSYESLDVITNKSIYFFNLDDFTLFGKKKERLEELIDNKEYDLLVSFDQSQLAVCQNFISDIKAGFKVGLNSSKAENIFNLSFEPDEKTFSYDKFYEQVRHYISVLNIKTIS